jgi:hypothetical protein
MATTQGYTLTGDGAAWFTDALLGLHHDKAIAELEGKVAELNLTTAPYLHPGEWIVAESEKIVAVATEDQTRLSIFRQED